MSEDPAPQDERIDPAFRNGTITTVGIVLGFSLSFVSAWASSPLPWSRSDVLVVLPMVAGIALQLAAMARMLQPNVLVLANYERARVLFIGGVILVAVGIAIALVLDVLGFAHRNLLR